MDSQHASAPVGDANRITRAYLDSLLIEMRHIDAVIPDTRLCLYGETFDTPVMMAALSHLDNCHPGGMAEMARGAYAANAVMWAGMGDDDELTRITATGAKTIKIIKPYANNDDIFKKIAHAEACGCIAVGMDIDHAFNGRGEYDVVLGLPMTGKSLAEIKEFVRATSLPFVIKGVLSAQDAYKCAEAGVQGLVVSHHHGILDYALPPLMVLPEVVAAVAKAKASATKAVMSATKAVTTAVEGKLPVFVDCGMESGLDVFKALALGATAVSVGRAVMGPLAADGAKGVTRLVRDITAQLAGAMARTCSPDIQHIDKTVLRRG